MLKRDWGPMKAIYFINIEGRPFCHRVILWPKKEKDPETETDSRRKRQIEEGQGKFG